MFATQHYMDVMPDARKKRLRDDDEPGNGFVGFGDHRSKRIHTLPLRSSPRPVQQWPAATPVHNDPLPRSHFSPWSSSPLVSSQPQDADMDMSDAAVSPSPYRVADACHLACSADYGAVGRLPTPMQPTFAAQVRGQQCEWAGPGPDVKTLNGVVNMGHHQTGLVDEQCVPRVLANGSDLHAVNNNRRLPSPISEVGDDSPCPHSPNMMIDDQVGHQPGPPGAHRTTRRSSADAMHHPNAMMDVECHWPPVAADSEHDVAAPSPGRRGHVRSKHTVNSWTWQPGMKKSFSIGYRSDCEKCRLKVPGHFNHIVIT